MWQLTLASNCHQSMYVLLHVHSLSKHSNQIVFFFCFPVLFTLLWFADEDSCCCCYSLEGYWGTIVCLWQLIGSLSLGMHQLFLRIYCRLSEWRKQPCLTLWNLVSASASSRCHPNSVWFLQLRCWQKGIRPTIFKIYTG